MTKRAAYIVSRCIAGALAVVLAGAGPATAQLPSLQDIATLTMSGPTQIEINRGFTYSGKLSALDVGVGLQKVEVVVDGVVGKSTTTNESGGYSVDLSFNAYGSYNLQAIAYRGTALETTSAIVRVEATAPVQETTTTDVAAASQFLYEGPNPVQQGVAPGTIEPVEAAVVRGSVATADGTPLTGVEVTIADHPEFGHTETTKDAVFDMAVNGGDYMTVRLEKDGFLPVERELDVSARDFEVAPDVVMTPIDPKVTTIELDGATDMQVARGSVVTDDAGSRQATLLFPEGTQATMELPDGSTRALSSLDVRATEFTVGGTGPAAMPGELPSTSAYTYAVEYSVDEALEAGATDVRFSKPVASYTDNFLDFPVGEDVPVGYYDREAHAWIASDDGRVVKVLSDTLGLADLDTDGDGFAESEAELEEMGITEEERQRVAELYDPGKTLWRVALDHFTPWDCNWPYGPEQGARGPKMSAAEAEQQDGQCSTSGSIVGCENQTLGEQIAIAGTPHSLVYDTSRVPGFKAGHSLDIPLTEGDPPGVLKRVELEVDVAGRRHSFQFAAAPNLRHLFTWDGKDAYGRDVQGTHTAKVRIGYVYNAVYYSSSDQWRQSFGQAGDQPMAGSRARNEVTIYQEYETRIGAVRNASGNSLAGWSLSAHHSYDASDGTLYLGTGEVRSADAFGVQIATFAGTGNAGPLEEGTYSGDGGAARNAGLSEMRGIAVGRDGSLFIADSGNGVIRKVTRDGTITTYAGGGSPAGNGDGGPALAAEFEFPTDVAVASDGSLYVLDTGSADVRRISPAGTITTVAGSGVDGPADEGPAVDAELYSAKGIGVGPADTLYIADTRHHLVRKVMPDGSITTVAGGGASLGDGGPATKARLSRPLDVAAAPDGTLFISDAGHRRVRRVAPDGTITTFAGNGDLPSWSDGDPAGAVGIARPSGIAYDASSDAVYFVERGRNRVARISTDGKIVTAAGTGASGSAGDGGPPAAARLNSPRDVALAPDGKVYISDSDNFQVRRIIDAMPGFSTTDAVVPSADGAELYQFDRTGRHLRTLDALTGAAVYLFNYDATGALSSIEDAHGNRTTIQRAADGTPSAITSPFGITTQLAVNAAGYLSRVTNAANEAVNMTYRAGGLLETFVTPKATHTFTYNPLGRLIRDDGPDGWFLTLDRDRFEDGYAVTTTSATGLKTTYSSRRNADGSPKRSVIDPAGGTTTTTASPNGTVTATYPDGTKTAAKVGPDPRWGMAAPVLSSLTMTTPAGRTSTVTGARSVTLSDPDNPLTLTAQTDTLTSNGKTTTRAFDKPAMKLTTTTPEGRQGVVTLNAKGQPTTVQAGSLAPVSYTYDARGRVESITQGSGSDARTTTMSYDANGFVRDVTDPRNDKTTFSSYDAVGRVKETTLADTNKIGFSYDAVGNLGSLTPPNRPLHGFDHYASDLLKTYTAPDLGDGTPRTTSYTYDLDRRPDVIDPPGDGAIDFGYDAAGRLASTAFSRGSISYAYVANTSKVATVTAPGSETTSYGYDGALVTSMGASGTSPATVGYGYDSDLRVNVRTLNSGNQVSYSYDKDGLITSAGGMTLGWDAVNSLLESTTAGSVSTTHGYNQFGEPTSDVANHGATNLYQANYEIRDNLGRITSKTETVGGVTSVYGYTYDNRGRLTNVSKDAAAYRSYTYDPNGNRLSATEDGTSFTGTYDAQDRLKSYGDATYTYTPDGQLKTKTVGNATTTYTYDELGNLTKVLLPDKTIDYVVDALGRRVARKIDGTITNRFAYGGGIQPIAELNASGGIKSQFVYGTKNHVPDLLMRNGTTYRLVTDQVGSVRMVVNTSTGEVAQQLEYDPFGNVLSDTNPGFQPFGFAGGLYDPDTGLVRFGHRDYDSVIGRWTERDPAGFAGGDPNLYAYVYNDPINLVDPTGEVAFIPLVLAAWAVVEVGFAIADAISTASTLADPCVSVSNKLMSGGLFIVGALAPGGGYSTGWRLGDDVFSLTNKGVEPAWSTVRSRYWKNRSVADDALDRYGQENAERMRRGLAPRRYNGDKGGYESMELSHEPVPRRDGGRDLVERWPCEHALVDPYRKPGYCR